MNNLICARLNGEGQFTLQMVYDKPIGPLPTSFEFNDFKIEIVLTNLQSGDVVLNLSKWEVNESKQTLSFERIPANKGKFTFQCKDNSLSMFKSVLLDIGNDYFTRLVEKIPEEESQQAYSILHTLSVCGYEKINRNDRVKYLTWLNEEINVNTTQEKIVLNLLTYYPKAEGLPFYTTIIENKKLFRDLFRQASEGNISEYLYAISNAFSEKWTESEINKAGETYAYFFVTKGTEEYMHNYKDIKEVVRLGGAFTEVSETEVSNFEIGRVYNIYADKTSTGAIEQVFMGMKTYGFADPVKLHLNENYSLIVPAFVAYEVLYRFRDIPVIELLNYATVVLLPEMTLSKLKMLNSVFKSKNIPTEGIDNVLLGELQNLRSAADYSSFVQNNLQRLITNRLTVWELAEVNRGKVLEEIWNITEYRNLTNLNDFRKNFPVLDFADDVVTGANEIISMKTFHPLNEANRTVEQFTTTLKANLNKLAEADLQTLTNIITQKGGSINLVGKDKVLTIVVKGGQWDVTRLERIARDVLNTNPTYRANGITQVYIKTF